MQKISLAGAYEVTVEGKVYEAVFPGTLDENGIGEQEQKAEQWHPDAATDASMETCGITTRLTRKHAVDGIAHFRKRIKVPAFAGERAFITVERARKLALEVNGVPVEPYEAGSLSTSYRFEATEFLKGGEENEICFVGDNTYQGWPASAIRYASAATNETQTNWNGLLGKLELSFEKEQFIHRIRVLPLGEQVRLLVEIDSLREQSVLLEVSGTLLSRKHQKQIILFPGKNEVEMIVDELRTDRFLWDEYEGNLETFLITGYDPKQPERVLLEEKTVITGIRTFGEDGKGHFAMNGHRIFLRSEANCCVFGDTGHPPMEVETWRTYMMLYRSYGINMVRFHSYCPPEAAFTAADELGMLVQPELSNWDPRTAMESDTCVAYYPMEMEQIIKTYGNHPSFCMLTFGNELHCNEVGLERLHGMLKRAKELDNTRSYAIGSNVFYGEKGADPQSDFYTSCGYGKEMLRGTSAGMVGYLNQTYPNTRHDYGEVMKQIRESYEKPVFSFEVGQFEVLPDFGEISRFQGVLIPNNLMTVQKRAVEKGLANEWSKWVAASGELARISYREEIEAALRTEDLSGISLLGLQDFPGQGTALVGMINSHMESKPYAFADPKWFQTFCKSQVPLVKMDRYTYTNREKLQFEVVFVNYGKKEVTGEMEISLSCSPKASIHKKVFCASSQQTFLGRFEIDLTACRESSQYALEITVGTHSNSYPVWIYAEDTYLGAGSCVVCQDWEEAKKYCEQGRTVFLSPKAEKEHFDQAVGTHFSTDFWSVGTFSFQEGYMGCLPDPVHPVFRLFPTEDHVNWQWWALTHGVAMELPEEVEPLFPVMDSYARMRKLGFLVEGNAFGGRLLVSSMGLLEKTQYPEVRAMLESIYRYLESDAFAPTQKIEQIFPI